MIVPGIVLSQPDSATTASKRCPRVTSSIESAITSRLTSEAFMPSVPIEMPSDTATVLNSIGVPPAARMPSFTFADRRRRWKLHGITSIQVLATPISGFARSSSVRPMALNMARAGRAVRTVGDGAAAMLGIVSHACSSSRRCNAHLFSSAGAAGDPTDSTARRPTMEHGPSKRERPAGGAPGGASLSDCVDVD